jgi:hypothetical protein
LKFGVCRDKTVDEVLRAFPFKSPPAPDLKITLDTWYAALEKQIEDMVLPDHVQVQRRGA